MTMESKQVFSLEVFHSFFEEGKCNCLVFDPSPATAGVLNKFGFMQKNKSNGFEMIFSSDKNMQQVMSYMEIIHQNYFEFEIVNRNPDFYFFTELPVNWLGQLMYSTKVSNAATEGKSISLIPEFLDQESKPRFGTVRIYVETVLAAGAGIKFQIDYQARATQWNYYVVNKSAVQLINPVISGKQDVSFDGPKNTTIQTGQQALLFSSGEKLLSLSERPKFKFDLVNKAADGQEKNIKSASAKTIFKGLPNPDPGRIGIENINGKTLVTSPIYVYI